MSFPKTHTDGEIVNAAWANDNETRAKAYVDAHTSSSSDGGSAGNPGVLIQCRRDLAANWAAINPVLADGEPGYEQDTTGLKIGDGVTNWVSLSYVGGNPPKPITPSTAAQIKDFAYQAMQIAGLFAYYKHDGNAFSSNTDYGPNAMHAGNHNYGGTFPGTPTGGTLLDQVAGSWAQGWYLGHGGTQWTGVSMNGTQVAMLNSASVSVVLAGLKPHDMSVQRTWFGLGTGTAMFAHRIAADGTLTITGGSGTSASSAAGMIVRFVPHIIITSYDNSAGKVTVWVGDWTGRFVTAINAASLSPATGLVNGSPMRLGGDGIAVGADGFLDDTAVYAGHAITSAEATRLFNETGYAAGIVTTTHSPGHRNGPFNRAWPQTQTISTNSTAAVTEFVAKAKTTFQPGAGGFNFYQFTTQIYIVTAAFRKNAANRMTINGPTAYGDPAQTLHFEDVPVPYSGRPSLGFLPSGGSDKHAAIWCPETAEYWDLTLDNDGTDLAPSWRAVFGGRLSNFNLFIGNMGAEGSTATGIPNMLGVPTIAELQDAIYNGVPIPHGLSAIAFDADNSYVWPAARFDGGMQTSNVIEGQIYRLKRDAATITAIAAMPHPTGRAMAQAAQTYGIVIVDRNLWATLLQTEDKARYLAVNGSDAYTTDPGGEPALGGILNGHQYAIDAMSGFPWDNLELLDHHAINPGDATQAARSAPTNITGTLTDGTLTLAWPDDPLAQYWNVYSKSGQSYTKIAVSYWPLYIIANASAMTLAVSAVNGGGESAKSADVVIT